jgi:hypothetical protein
MIGQIGSPGTLWSNGEYGNQLETLAYAITNTALNGAGNGWGDTIVAGVVNDVSSSNTFENGVSGSAVGNSIYMKFSSMQSGWYTVFFGGTNSDYTSTSYNLSVSAVAAVPEPGTWAMMVAGLGVLGALARRRRG